MGTQLIRLTTPRPMGIILEASFLTPFFFSPFFFSVNSCLATGQQHRCPHLAVCAGALLLRLMRCQAVRLELTAGDPALRLCGTGVRVVSAVSRHDRLALKLLDSTL